MSEFHWNQAILEKESVLNRGLVSLLAFNPHRSPKLIGTAFVISAQDRVAVAATAAHNFRGIIDVQNPHSRHHPSALPEFLPRQDVLRLDAWSVMAMVVEGRKIGLCPLGWVVFDEKSDIACFSIVQSIADDPALFRSNFELECEAPDIGDEVAVLGYSRMRVLNEFQDGSGGETFSVRRQLVFRRGRVTQAYPNGHLLCRGACVETSIPVFPGMSGGPVFKIGRPNAPMKPFGIVSSDIDGVDDKFDRTAQGASIAALLRPSIADLGGGDKMVKVNFDNGEFTLNPDINVNK